MDPPTTIVTLNKQVEITFPFGWFDFEPMDTPDQTCESYINHDNHIIMSQTRNFLMPQTTFRFGVLSLH
ncbi:hypothetical protein PRUPE_8G170500 [Prunus persica]|uniref:Uncharacterized protein n=1 Tax=Prunus persica TaxID=3760 RepID=M5VN67_PRUPE|nr:hypothetical protein PRUPE_8G170500 [Prunus persica]